MPEPHENGPFQSDREAHAAAVAAIPPEAGWSILSQAQCSQLMHDALTAAGVETSTFEDRTVWGLGNWEDYLSATIARWVTAAHEAGKASAMEGAVTEWALSYTHRPNLSGLPVRRVVEMYPDEASTREAVDGLRELSPEDEPKLMRREVSPWKEMPDA